MLEAHITPSHIFFSGIIVGVVISMVIVVIIIITTPQYLYGLESTGSAGAGPFRGWAGTDLCWAQHGAIMGLQLAEQLEMEKTERITTANVNFPIVWICLDLLQSSYVFLTFYCDMLLDQQSVPALGIERCLTLCEDSERPCFETPYSSQAMAMAGGCRGPAWICGDCIGS